MKFEFLSPVGRLVQGDAFTPQTTNKTGQPLTDKLGNPRVSYFVGVAFPKNDPAFGPLYQQMIAAARAGFPTMIDAQGRASHPRFAWKLMDGDGVDDDGKSNATKPGFAGHWVLKCSSGFPPKCYYAGRYNPHEQIQDPKAIPRGYYVRVHGTFEANGDATKPGLYVNFDMVELVGGEPSMIITSGPDASQVFGGAAAQLPAGVPPVAMAAPTGNVPPVPTPTAPQVPTLPTASVASGAPLAPPTAMPGLPPVAPVAVAPNPAFLQGPGASAPPALAPVLNAAPPLPAGLPAPSALPAMTSPSEQRVMTAAAQGHSYEKLIAGGWTDATLRQHGLMI